MQSLPVWANEYARTRNGDLPCLDTGDIEKRPLQSLRGGLTSRPRPRHPCRTETHQRPVYWPVSSAAEHQRNLRRCPTPAAARRLTALERRRPVNSESAEPSVSGIDTELKHQQCDRAACERAPRKKTALNPYRRYGATLLDNIRALPSRACTSYQESEQSARHYEVNRLLPKHAYIFSFRTKYT